MTATYRISQGASVGTYGRSRLDLAPASVSGDLTLEAQTTTHTTYLWEVLSAPIDAVAVTLATPTAHSTLATVEGRGSYLISLTVDAGLSTQNVSVMVCGLPLENCGLPMPATWELNQDNSVPPYTGAQGWWYKLERLFAYFDGILAINIIGVDLRGTSKTTTVSCAAGASVTGAINIGLKSGVGQFLKVTASVSTIINSDIEFYANVGLTNRVYKYTAADCTLPFVDPITWPINPADSTLSGGLLYYKITNNHATDATTYDIELLLHGVKI